MARTGARLDPEAVSERDRACRQQEVVRGGADTASENCAATQAVQTKYDGLGRVTVMTNPDATTQTSSYAGADSTHTDEVGNARTLKRDALGRLTSVVETVGGVSQTTSYPSYDLLDNLLTVTQGTQTSRTFEYDKLSRLTNASNPESGAVAGDEDLQRLDDTGSDVDVRYLHEWKRATMLGAYDGEGRVVAANTPNRRTWRSQFAAGHWHCCSLYAPMVSANCVGGLPGADPLPSHWPWIACTARAGSRAMMRSSAAAGPVGRRRSCSQFWSVLTLTPIKLANSDWERLVRSRMERTWGASTTNRREGFRSPRKIAPPSRTLPSSSWNIVLSKVFAFISKLLFDQSGQLRGLPRRQVCRDVL